MSTTVKTGWLEDNNGEYFAPKTLTSQVQTNDGMLLEDKLAEIYVNKEEIIDVEYGGTGANNANDARANIGAAPAGFGLGENVGKNTLTTDANDLILPGWYRCGADTLNNPYGAACVIRVDSINESSVTQTAYHYYPTRNSSKVRTKEGSTWSNWVDCSPSAFAPAGFGLGTSAKTISSMDLIDGTGTYDWGDGNVSWIINHYKFNDKYAMQIATAVNTKIHGTTRKRLKINGTWDEWEWVNPPMIPGEEYRTTERFLGQPVYTMIRRIGGFTGNGTCTLGSTGYHAVVRVCATTSYGGVLLKVDDSKVKTIQHSAGYVYIQVSIGGETCTDCYVQMWYTK